MSRKQIRACVPHSTANGKPESIPRRKPEPLAARGESAIGRVPSAAGADARRRDAGDTGISSRSANAADAPAPPEPFGRIGIAGNLCVARRQRCPRIASSSRLDLARNTYVRDLLYFHHGLLVFDMNCISSYPDQTLLNNSTNFGLKDPGAPARSKVF